MRNNSKITLTPPMVMSKVHLPSWQMMSQPSW